ncbi:MULTISPECIES: hypothetical protein [unclassified Streptomyces]|uniref:hypothetical protein n=1 Tax=unclassified Streptomyces TaxID=2593676 RepID=UPI002E354E8E|nr:hypothetical protein [Streptomyces sp. NBC_01455]
MPQPLGTPRRMEGRGIPLLNQSRQRPVWPFVLLGSLLGLAVLAAVGTWVYGVYSMSDPATSLVVGMRIDGSRISVKMPTCPTDKVGTVEVYDSDSEKLLWQASGPKTQEGKRGAVTLWKADDFLKAEPGTHPKTLPANLDVSVTFAGVDDGTGDVFNVRKVKAAHVPDGQYWTRDGSRTASQIDAQFKCHASS